MENNDLVTRMADACGLSEEDTQRLQNVFEQLAQAIHLVETISDEVCRATLSNKQYHLCKHAKKARTRKKYQNLAFRRFSHAN